MVNKLPNIDTDVESKISVRGEFAYLAPGSPKGTQFQGEATSYIDDFEGTQNGISLLSPFSWQLSSRPLNLFNDPSLDAAGVQNGYDRAFLNWYTIDPYFFIPINVPLVLLMKTFQVYTLVVFMLMKFFLHSIWFKVKQPLLTH